MEARILATFAISTKAGGMYRAVESGLVQRRIGESAQRFQAAVESGEQTVVGVNAYTVDETASARSAARSPTRADARAPRALRGVEGATLAAAVQRALDALARAAQDDGATSSRAVVAAAAAGCTHGEICATLRRELGFGHVQVVSLMRALPAKRASPRTGWPRFAPATVRRSRGRSARSRMAAPLRARCCARLAPHAAARTSSVSPGAPGAGKSTLIDALLGEYLARGQRVAVVAIDPSSPITGGAVLGDRVRMGEHGTTRASSSARSPRAAISAACREPRATSTCSTRPASTS